MGSRRDYTTDKVALAHSNVFESGATASKWLKTGVEFQVPGTVTTRITGLVGRLTARGAG